jgi:hypothetical protein
MQSFKAPFTFAWRILTLGVVGPEIPFPTATHLTASVAMHQNHEAQTQIRETAGDAIDPTLTAQAGPPEPAMGAAPFLPLEPLLGRWIQWLMAGYSRCNSS